MPRLRRLLPLAAALALTATAPSHAAFGPVGTLDQLPGADGCVRAGDAAPCRQVRAITPLVRFAMSPDGSTIVAPSVFDFAAVLRRDPATGALHQSPTVAGCVGPAGNSVSCRPAPNLEQAIDAAFSPDGRHVYIVGANGIASFDHVADADTGGLVPLPGASACHSNNGAAQPGNEAARCTDGRELSNLSAVAVSPDGAFVYAAADPAGTDSDGLVILSRDPATGALSQAAGPRGCVTVIRTATGDEPPFSGCGGELRGASNPTDVAAAPDGTVFLTTSQGVIALRRDAQNLLHQPAGPEACVTSAAQAGCADGRALGEPFSLALSPDGASLYVASSATPEVAHLRLSGGGMAQPGDAAGCVADAGNPSDGPAGSCVPARSLGGVISGAGVSPDGRTVAVSGSASDDEVAILERDTSTGALSQAADFRGCVSRSGEATGTGGGPGKCYVASGAGGGAFAWTPGGEHFYAGGGGDSSIAFLRREVAPACADASAVTNSIQPVTLAFPCADANGDTVTLELARGPERGTASPSGTSATFTPHVTSGGVDTFAVRPRDASGNAGPDALGTVKVFTAIVEPPFGKAPLPRAVTKTLRPDRRRRMRFSLACPAEAPAACKGRLVIRTAKVRTTRRGRARVVAVASLPYEIAPGRTQRLSFRASRTVLRVLRLRRTARLTVELIAPSQGHLLGGRATARATLRR